MIRLLLASACVSVCIVGCVTTKESHKNPEERHPVESKQLSLVSITILDNNGLSETVSTKERMKSYEKVNFLASQPYQRVQRVFCKDELGRTLSILTSYHSNGQVKQYLEIVDGRACGRYFEWYVTGKRKIEAHVIAGIADLDEKSQAGWSFDGVNCSWNEEGQLLARVPYVKGRLEGMLQVYHASGRVIEEIPHVGGLIQGELRIFDERGALLEKTYYVAGKKRGLSQGYWSSLQPQWQEVWNDDVLETGTYYDVQGRFVCEVVAGVGKRCIFNDVGPSEIHEYQRGKPEGEVLFLKNNRFVTRRLRVKDGKKHGAEIRYWDPETVLEGEETPLVPRLSIDWHEGEIHGLVKTWYRDGTQESQREMSHNDKLGTLIAWYRNGSVMLIEEYENKCLLKGDYFKPSVPHPISQIRNGKGVATLFDASGNFLRRIPYAEGKPLDEHGSFQRSE